MKVIKQSAHIVKEWVNMNLYERCEFAGRISHASEDKIKEGSAEEFVRRMVKLGHESVFEFARVKFYESHTGVNLRKLRENFKLGYPLTKSHYSSVLRIGRDYPAFFQDMENKLISPSLISNDYTYWKRDDTWIPVLITTNRAISHQLVRYRKDVVYLQASQRYIMLRDDVDFIDPGVYFPEIGSSYQQESRTAWEDAMLQAEKFYKTLVRYGEPAQAARLVLPNSTATKLIMYASPDTWRHVFEQRISSKADPMIRELLEPLKEEFVKEGLL